MKLKRFHAPDIRQAINRVREELGADAVILSNRQVDGGVEIVAAVDYDDAVFEQSAAETEAVARQAPPVASQAAANEPIVARAPARKTAAWQQALQEEYQSAVAETPARPAKPETDPQTPPTQEWVRQLQEDYQRIQNSTQASERPEEALEPVRPAVASPARAMHDVEEVPQSPQEMSEVWGELKELRGLLERQLSSLTWGDAAKRFPQKTKALRKLLEMGLSAAVARRIMHDVRESDAFEQVWRRALNTLAGNLRTLNDDIIEQGGVIALIGSTGVGKTTTIAKIAARFALRHGTNNIALITTDNYRVGAQEQLRTYGRIMDAPVRVANDADELKNVLKSLYDKKLVLIDTAGMSQRDMRLSEQFRLLSEGSSLIKSYLVLSAASQMPVLDETVRAYQKVVLDGCILTKTDECSRLGDALSVLYHHQLPLAYYSNGQRVPEDLHRARSTDLVKQAVDMMNKNKLRLDDEDVEMAFGGLSANDFA